MEDDDQLTSLYRLPDGGRSTDIVVDIDDKISPSSGMRSKKVSKLLYPGVCSRHFYRFEGEDVTKARSLICNMMELAGLRSYNILNKTDVILTLSEAKEMEVAL